jgi:hypothetical protein
MKETELTTQSTAVCLYWTPYCLLSGVVINYYHFIVWIFQNSQGIQRFN